MLVTVAGSALAFAAMPASASNGYFTLQSVSTQSWTTTGEAVTDTYQGFIDCTWTSGGSTFAGSCTTGAGVEPINGSFVQVGSRWEITGSIGPGPITGALIGTCSTSAVTSPPTFYWTKDCHFVVH